MNCEGKRFINEDVYHGRSAHAILAQSGHRAFHISDNKIFERPITQMNHQLLGAWETVAEMEKNLGLPSRALQKTVADYNRFAAQDEDPAFHKEARWLRPIDEAPFAALDCSLGAAMFHSLSLGGVETTADGDVVAGNGLVIPGLYATGSMAPTIALDGFDYASGMLLSAGTFFGRRAGRAASGR